MSGFTGLFTLSQRQKAKPDLKSSILQDAQMSGKRTQSLSDNATANAKRIRQMPMAELNRPSERSSVALTSAPYSDRIPASEDTGSKHAHPCEQRRY